MLKLSTIRKIVVICIIFALGFGVGHRYGNYRFELKLKDPAGIKFNIINQIPPEKLTVDFSQFWIVWDKVSQKFVDRQKIDPQKMVEGATVGMVEALGDPYTVYLPQAENSVIKEGLKGSFEGVGISLGLKEKKVVVIAPLSDTPADKAGVLAGDHIYKVNDKILDGKSLPEAMALIRGPKGTKVKLTLTREGGKKEIIKELMRDTIVIKSVDLKFVQDTQKNKFAHLKLFRFGERTNDEWLVEIAEIEKHKNEIHGVILDLRGNTGGYLELASFVAGEFLPFGRKVVTQRGVESDTVYSVNRTGKLLDTPLVVLINEGSASASEILAGALKDYKRAKLIGMKSFGKGSVQEAEDLVGGDGLHVTIAKWLTPNGTWINGTGIKPDIEVKNDPKKPKEDKQLERAMEELTK